jgi:hypothetical protein
MLSIAASFPRPFPSLFTIRKPSEEPVKAMEPDGAYVPTRTTTVLGGGLG